MLCQNSSCGATCHVRNKPHVYARLATDHHSGMADAAFLTELVSREVLMRAVGRALRAPSVHNSQPWQWRISDGVR